MSDGDVVERETPVADQRKQSAKAGGKRAVRRKARGQSRQERSHKDTKSGLQTVETAISQSQKVHRQSAPESYERITDRSRAPVHDNSNSWASKPVSSVEAEPAGSHVKRLARELHAKYDSPNFDASATMPDTDHNKVERTNETAAAVDSPNTSNMKTVSRMMIGLVVATPIILITFMNLFAGS